MSSQPDNGDWLDGCVGFAVENGVGRVGRVAELRRDSESGRPEALVVRAGLAGMHRFDVPVDEIAGVLPASRRIIVSGSFRAGRERDAAPAALVH